MVLIGINAALHCSACVSSLGLADARDSEEGCADTSVGAVLELELDVIDLEVVSDVDEIAGPP